MPDPTTGSRPSRGGETARGGHAPLLSAELFTIPLGEARYILYAPLRRTAFVANGQVVNFLAGLREGRRDRARDPDGSLVDFLRRLEILDAGPESQPVGSAGGRPEPTTVTLFLTTECNLRCTYCYAEAGDRPKKTMSLDVARRGIDFVAANAARTEARRFQVAFHGGGEPTVNWRTMTEALAYARREAEEMGLEVAASTATNGVLSEAQVDWILANFRDVSVSMDGLPSIQDRHRVTPTGGGSSDRVLNTLRRFDAASYAYGLRLTVTAETLPTLPDSTEFIFRNFHPARVQVEPAYAMGRWSRSVSAETSAFLASFRAAQAAAQRLGKEIVFSAARVPTLTNHFCAASQDNFCLSPDGNVSACFEAFSEDAHWAKTFFYGEPDTAAGGYRFDHGVLDNLRRRTVERLEHCRGCFARWHCAGDCHYRALGAQGDGPFAGTDRCHITRELTKDQILARISRAGGLFWHEPRGEAPSAAPPTREGLS